MGTCRNSAFAGEMLVAAELSRLGYEVLLGNVGTRRTLALGSEIRRAGWFAPKARPASSADKNSRLRDGRFWDDAPPGAVGAVPTQQVRLIRIQSRCLPATACWIDLGRDSTGPPR